MEMIHLYCCSVFFSLWIHKCGKIKFFCKRFKIGWEAQINFDSLMNNEIIMSSEIDLTLISYNEQSKKCFQSVLISL